MSETELETYTVGGEPAENPSSYGAGQLRSILENEEDEWRAAVDIHIEASDEDEVKEVAEDIVEKLSELGDIDEI